jgi:hypothetical protein
MALEKSKWASRATWCEKYIDCEKIEVMPLSDRGTRPEMYV